MTTQEFNALPRQEKKVLIAQDVLESMRNDIYVANTGSYLRDLMITRTVGDQEDIKENFDNIRECHVCALGACLLSTVKFKNTLKFADLGWDGIDVYVESTDKVWRILQDIFEPEELMLIELCFEQGSNEVSLVAKDSFGSREIRDYFDIGHRFGMRYPDSHDRLEALMKNIIKNSGEFIPE